MAKEEGTHLIYVEPKGILESLGISDPRDPMARVLLDANQLGLEGKKIRRLERYTAPVAGFGERLVFKLYWEKDG